MGQSGAVREDNADCHQCEKVFRFSPTDTDVARLWQHGAAPGNLQTVSCFKYLGVYIDTTMEPVPQQEVAEVHLQKAKSSLARVKALPMAMEQRSQVAAASTMTSLTFAPWGWDLEYISVESHEEPSVGGNTRVYATQG